MKQFYAVFVILIVLFSVTKIAYSEEKGYLVEDSILMKGVSGDKIFEPANMSGCHALKGSEASITEKSDYGPIKDFWIKVEILSGSCAGENGWIEAKRFRY